MNFSSNVSIPDNFELSPAIMTNGDGYVMALSDGVHVATIVTSGLELKMNKKNIDELMQSKVDVAIKAIERFIAE